MFSWCVTINRAWVIIILVTIPESILLNLILISSFLRTLLQLLLMSAVNQRVNGGHCHWILWYVSNAFHLIQLSKLLWFGMTTITDDMILYLFLCTHVEICFPLEINWQYKKSRQTNKYNRNTYMYTHTNNQENIICSQNQMDVSLHILLKIVYSYIFEDDIHFFLEFYTTVLQTELSS